MSIYLETTEGEQIQAASNLGWSQFCKWIDSIEGEYEQIKNLTQHNWGQLPAVLVEELHSALESFPPQETVEKTAREIGDWFLTLPEDEGIIVTNGISPCDD